MTRHLCVGLVVLAGVIAAPTPAADPPKVAATKWVAAYEKLGGKATFESEDGGRLVISRLKDSPPVEFASLGEPAAVERVVLHGGRVTDDDVKRVAGWAGVRRVELSDGFAVTDAGVRGIAANPSVTHVVLGDTAMTSAGVNAFSGHAAVTHLWAVNSNLVPSAVRSVDLDSMPALVSIQLSCPRLAALRLADCKSLAEVVGLPPAVETVVLADLPKLAELDARGTKLNKLSVSGKCGLTSLNVRRTQLTERQVAALKAVAPGAEIKSDWSK